VDVLNSCLLVFFTKNTDFLLILRKEFNKEISQIILKIKRASNEKQNLFKGN